jgi:hypothetical protein
MMGRPKIAPVVNQRTAADSRFVEARSLLSSMVDWFSFNIAAIQLTSQDGSLTVSASTDTSFRFFMRTGGRIDVRWKRPARPVGEVVGAR